MTAPDDRPSLAERYSSAVQSSQLKVTPDRTGDVDLLIAAGWAREGLGGHLYRLRVQFDGGGFDGGEDENRPALTMLTPALHALQDFAAAAAARERWRFSRRTISAIANTALYAWLSPVCVRCHGRGFNGGFGVPVVFCTACVGLGKRLLWLSKTDQGNALGRLLLRHMDEKTTLVAERMGRFLRHHRALPQVRRSAAERELTRQLADLRSTEAQED